MENNSKILDFIDGTLSSTEEDELFRNMSSNEELRAELKHQMAIKEAVKSDVKAFTPSPDSTIRIFDKLGFTSPVPAVIPAPIPVNPAGTIGFFAKYAQGLTFALVSSILTGLTVLTFMKPANENINMTRNQTKTPSTENIKTNSEVPNIVSTETESRKSDNTVNSENKVRTVVKYVYRDREPVIESVTSQTSEPEPQRNIVLLSGADFRNNDISQNKMNRNPANMNDNPDLAGINHEYQPYGNISTGSDYLSVELISSEPYFLQNVDISPENYSAFNKMGIGMNYIISDHFQIGMNVRQETFSQSFTGKESNDNTYRYEQQPNLTTYSLSTKILLADLGLFKPVINLNAGVNNAGFVGRIMGGTYIQAYPGLSFLLSLEYSGLRFKHQNNYFNSTKLGFNYGIGFNF
jgi:hypothetical protein